MEQICSQCKSQSVVVTFTGCHCLECGHNFGPNSEYSFFRW